MKLDYEELSDGLIRVYRKPDINFYTYSSFDDVIKVMGESMCLSDAFLEIKPVYDRIVTDDEVSHDVLDSMADFLWEQLVDDGVIIGLTYYRLSYGIYFMVDKEFGKVLDEELGEMVKHGFRKTVYI